MIDETICPLIIHDEIQNIRSLNLKYYLKMNSALIETTAYMQMRPKLDWLLLAQILLSLHLGI